MKIKQKRQVNLPQLIEWVWENDADGCYKAVGTENIYVEVGQTYIDTFYGDSPLNSKTRFEIEEEVEIDEYTVLEKYILINNKKEIYFRKEGSIYSRITSIGHANHGTKFIYLRNEDGSIGELIWKDGEMVE